VWPAAVGPTTAKQALHRLKTADSWPWAGEPRVATAQWGQGGRTLRSVLGASAILVEVAQVGVRVGSINRK
jgi:hypothetical protein